MPTVPWPFTLRQDSDLPEEHPSCVPMCLSEGTARDTELDFMCREDAGIYRPGFSLRDG